MNEVCYWGPGEFVNVVCGRQLIASRLPFAYARHDLQHNVLWVDGAVAVDGVDCAITFDTVFHSYESPYAANNSNTVMEDDNSESDGEEGSSSENE